MGKKILLADDSITIQKVIELTFSDEDFDVITVGNGRLALEKLSEVRPDIVLCDVIMPEKDGYEVCEQIKTNPATSHIPVLLLTGAFEPFDQERAARAGYDGSLAKPFEPETLIAKVKELLARVPARASAPPSAPASRPADAPPPLAVVAPPPVLPFQRPAPPVFAPPAPAVEPAAPSFIPEEPFGGFDESALAGTVSPPADAFAPVTEEESAALLAPPVPEPPSADAASTVMFHAGDLPWNAPASPEPPRVTAVAPPPTPGTAPPPEVAEEPAVFEEVLEEDLDFGGASFEPGPTDSASGAPPYTRGVASLPPLPPADEGAATGAFQAGDAAPLETEPPPVFEPEPFEPGSPAVPEPPPARPAVAESFADVAAAVAVPAAPPPPPSEAATLSVPVEMVEKIAQRVVAQISEKAVREIAWEVIPDLAEALITQEIERLKAELQKT